MAATLVERVGDATAPEGSAGEPRVLLHICNDLGRWGRGFVKAVSRRWPEPEARYRAWYAGQERKAFALGKAQFVRVDKGLWVANLVGQRGLKPRAGLAPIRYDAVREGLLSVQRFALKRGASVHMPRIGCGLAGGRWAIMAELIAEALLDAGVSVTVYDPAAASE